MSDVIVQALNGLASASNLFLVAAGLSLIFGVTRIVNFAHGSFYMLGGYVAYSLVGVLGATPIGLWGAMALAPLAIAALGGLLEVTLLRRIYRAPQLFQLLATFGVVLVVQDLVLLVWGPQDRLGPRAPGLEGAIDILGRKFPTYDLFLIALGPLVLAGLWLLLKRTRWGVLIRAATEDREMVAALGVSERHLFTGVFVLGTLIAALGGSLQLPRQAIHHGMDLEIIVETFVVVVIGGLGSIGGAYVAAVLIGLLNALGIAVFPQIAIVLVFLVMAAVLIVRPHGLFGRAEAPVRVASPVVDPLLRPPSAAVRNAVAAGVVALAALPLVAGPYGLSVATEVLIFVLVAASLHLMTGIGGMVSFGHAAFFGAGAYGAALVVRHLQAPMEMALVAGPLLAGAIGLVFGWFCVRLSGVYLAMLTLAFAQILWSVAFQWYAVTGGDNGLLGVWPSAWTDSPARFYLLVLGITAAALYVLWRIVFSPFGYALRACRDSVRRAETIGIDRRTTQWLGIALAGAFAGIAGALYAFLKGSVFPDVVAIPVSIDALTMILLGGINALAGPVVGAVVYKTLLILLASETDYWRLVVGITIIALVVIAPEGIVGFVTRRLALPDTNRADTTRADTTGADTTGADR